MASLPCVAESDDEIRALLSGARASSVRDRLHLLILVKSGAVRTASAAAERLLRHRNTIAAWLRLYRSGGIKALVHLDRPGRPVGQCSIPEAAFEAMQARLSSPSGFASYVELERWLADEHGVVVPYSTLHQIVRYGLGAKLKAPRPVHPKKAM